jgi:hypothetical protein
MPRPAVVRRRSPGSWLARAALVAVALGAVSPTGASAARARLAMWSDRVPAGRIGRPMRDTLLRGDSMALRASAASDVYRTPGNEPIRVMLSRAFIPNRAAVQSFVNFLGSRLHGSELSRLTAYLAPISEVALRCGNPGALACYSPNTELMIVPGENSREGQFSKEFLVTHEYGHHIARNRNNSPWLALARGPKRWDTFHHVCQRIVAHELVPGGSGAQYTANPGEAWAESYAFYHYPTGQPWQFTPLLAPVPGTRPAIRGDVLSPWRGAKTVVKRGVFSRTGAPVATRTFATPLDGRITFGLSGPTGSNLDLEVVLGGRVVATSKRRGSREFIAGDLCGVRRVAVRVRRIGGAGAFRLIARVP